MPKLAKDKCCTGCLACKDACRHGAIQVVLKNGIPFPKVNTDMCVECKLCEKTCPVVSPISKNNVSDMLVYGGWAADEKTRYQGASGGAFGGIAQSFFQQMKSPVVFGATLDNNHVRHIMIDRFEDVPLLMNSKYIQSNTDGIYHQVALCLRDNHDVLFSGTPCQVAGLYGFLGKKRNTEHLWTVELVCHGIASQEALDIAKKVHHFDKLYSFRNKEHGQAYYVSQCCTYWDGDERKTMKRKDDVFYQIFSTWLLDRKSCSNCMFSSIERVADITLADFWGGAKKEEDYQLGVNLIIANNQHGNLLVESADGIEIYPATLMQAINSNSNLYTGYKFVQYHPLVLFPNFFRKVLPEKVRLAILTRKYPWIFLWAPYKLMTKWYATRKKKMVMKKYNDVL
ncbi:Coenzyme F420 hydrogenase/dehydrogenase, beta subunit C-terminal domain [Prevotella sp.]|uniref:Coenzyme F420 hydrogenase/dehydrogenase, beta subunit C-terminal domain n=1 Tax=Prevotella sp. TaxID=59823 RepID=UPI003F7EAE44